jgi:hypothetical protein
VSETHSYLFPAANSEVNWYLIVNPEDAEELALCMSILTAGMLRIDSKIECKVA